MKTLAVLASFALATPVFACPGHDDGDATKATKTADTKKAPAKTDQPATQKAQKPTDAAKTKDTAKKPDKVSQN